MDTHERVPGQPELVHEKYILKVACMKSISTNKNIKKNRIILQLCTLLSRQVEILNKYIELGDKEKQAVISGQEQKLNHYLELEAIFTAKAKAYNKSIHTFFKLYPKTAIYNDPKIISLTSQINHLQTRLLQLNKENREAIKNKMDTLESELEELSKKKRNKSSPFKKIGNPSYIDTTA